MSPELCACGHLDSIHDHAGACWRDHECGCGGFNPYAPMARAVARESTRAVNPGAQKRWRMWRKNPRCYYCGIHTRFVHRGGQQHCRDFTDDEATIEHLYSRLNPERGTHQGKRNLVIACRRCNAAQNDKEQRALSKAELQRRSGYSPQQRPA